MEAGRKAGSPATAARGSVLNDGGPCKLRSNDLPGPSEEAILVATPVETPGLALSEGLDLSILGLTKLRLLFKRTTSNSGGHRP